MYQKLIIVGNLGRDPEMRYLSDGTAVTNFSVATSRRWTDGSGNPQEETTWIRVSAWGRQAEAANQYLNKGSKVLVEGRLRPDKNGSPRTYTGQDGIVRASFEMTAETVRFLSTNNGNGNGNGELSFVPAGGAVMEEDEIPF